MSRYLHTMLRVGNLDILAPIVPLLSKLGASASTAASLSLPAIIRTEATVR